jgi:hypothetical protein
MIHLDVVTGDVVVGRVARFEYASGAPSVGDRRSIEDDANVVLAFLETRRTRIIPYGFLSRAGLDGFGPHDGIPRESPLVVGR